MVTFGDQKVIVEVSDKKIRNCILSQIKHGFSTHADVKIKPDSIIVSQCQNYPCYLKNCYLQLPHGKWPGAWFGGGNGAQANIISLPNKFVYTVPSELWKLILDYL